MENFVKSIGDAGQSPGDAASRHHGLFETFHSVAVRYSELKSAASAITTIAPAAANTAPGRAEQHAALGLEMGNYLCELGLQPQPYAEPEDGIETSTECSFADPNMDGAAAGPATSYLTQLDNWYFTNQQMMGLLDNDQVQF